MSKMVDPDLKQEEAGVSRELAARRHRQIAGLHYALDLRLSPDLTTLHGCWQATFELAGTESPVILDFRDLDEAGDIREGAISNVKTGARPVTGLTQTNGHLVIPGDVFQTGRNELTLDFTAPIAIAGRPLIRFNDGAAAFVYLLSVPMDASLAFPCFDQPDLKARFSLTFETPENFTVVSNGELLAVESTAPGRLRHRFQTTPPLSTYLFSFAAGPFAKLESPATDLPVRLFVRPSQLARATAEWPEVCQLTTAGIDHLQSYLDCPFPFAKYDQVLLPGFPFRGMEHAAATFLREESILFPSTPTRGDRLTRAALVLHELVHQWFGDLVTMRWFDDLWLKEGFANYLAYRTMAALTSRGIMPETTDERQIWKRFHLTHKPLATAIDASPGTTPLRQDVPNLRDAKSAYGAIVYQKAPCLLRALTLTLGEETFQAGVRRFLHRHAFDNADWRDLVSAFEDASGRDLDDWATAWITRHGMPQIDLDWEWRPSPSPDRSPALHLRLTQHDLHHLDRHWPLEIRLRLVYADGSSRTLQVSLNSRQTELIDTARPLPPDFIIPNDEDHGYGRFIPAASDLDAIATSLSGFDDPFQRTQLWSLLWDSLAAGRLAPTDFLNLARRELHREHDEELLQLILERLALTCERRLSPGPLSDWIPTIETALEQGMTTAANHGHRILFFRTLRRLATTDSARRTLRDLLDGVRAIPGITLSQTDRWQIITTLLALGDPEAESRLTLESRRDQTADGQRQAWIAAAARPDHATKEQYFKEYLRHHGIAEDWIEPSLANFNCRHQAALTRPFLRSALAALPQLKREKKIFFVIAWLEAFINGQPAAAAAPIIAEFLASTPLDADLVAKIRQIERQSTGD